VDQIELLSKNNKLGVRFTEEESVRFTEGLRKYGADFKRLCAVVGTKDLSEVETYYNQNCDTNWTAEDNLCFVDLVRQLGRDIEEITQRMRTKTRN